MGKRFYHYISENITIYINNGRHEAGVEREIEKIIALEDSLRCEIASIITEIGGGAK